MLSVGGLQLAAHDYGLVAIGKGQTFHGQQEVVHVDQQHGQPFLGEGRGGNVADSAKPAVQRLDDDLALPQKTIDDDPETLKIVAQHEQIHVVPGRGGDGTADDIGPIDKADAGFLQPEELAAFDRFNLPRSDIDHASDTGQRRGVSFAGDLKQQRPHHRQRDGKTKREGGTSRRLGDHADAASHIDSQRPHNVQPDTAPRHFRDGAFERESGQEQKVQQFRLVQPGNRLCIG